MNNKLTVIINTLNDEKIIQRVISSVSWADEILICDMESEDETVKIAKKAGAKVISCKREKYVELARNFSVSHASNDWILILDPDEEIPKILAERIREMIAKPIVSDYVEIPRKNIIFGCWMKASGWWPDYNIRLFKKGNVSWGKEIHRPPKVEGQGLKLPEEENFAIVHHHYESISQFISRLNRYTDAQAEGLIDDGYKFNWSDLINKPVGEFMSRYFVNRGFEDGLHGLALGLLQAFSYLVMYLKVWEKEKFKEQEISLADFSKESQKAGQEINYWFKYANLSKNPFKRFIQKAKNRIS